MFACDASAGARNCGTALCSVQWLQCCAVAVVLQCCAVVVVSLCCRVVVVVVAAVAVAVVVVFGSGVQ